MTKKFFLLLITIALTHCYACAFSFAFTDLQQAELSFLKGDYNITIKYCDSVIAKDDVNAPRACYLKAMTLFKQNKIEQARSIFNEILSNSRDNELSGKAQLAIADTFFVQENFDAAIGEYRKVQEKYPLNSSTAAALYKLGRSYLKSGRIEEARFCFQELEQEFPLSFESKLMDEADDTQFVHSVQIGCFSKYENAEKLTEKLRKTGFDAYINERDGYPVFYRVRVGRFKTKSDALACRALLDKRGYKTKLCP